MRHFEIMTKFKIMTHGKILRSLGNLDKMAISILFYEENLLSDLNSLKFDFSSQVGLK